MEVLTPSISTKPVNAGPLSLTFSKNAPLTLYSVIVFLPLWLLPIKIQNAKDFQRENQGSGPISLTEKFTMRAIGISKLLDRFFSCHVSPKFYLAITFFFSHRQFFIGTKAHSLNVFLRSNYSLFY